MKVTTLHQLFIHELKDAYSAEQQLLIALPKMIAEAQHSDLKRDLSEHLKQTEMHAERLEEVFEFIGEKAVPHVCQAMKGLIAEGEEGLKDADLATVDLLITGAAQRIEHYEQVLYTILQDMAKIMKHGEAADLLNETLNEEIAAGKKMAAIGRQLAEEAPVGHETP